MKYNYIQTALDSISLLDLATHIQDYEARTFFLGAPGKEHYKLLAYFSTTFNKQILFDIGTYKGCSALALAYNNSNQVKSFDIVNVNKIKNKPENIEWYFDNFLTYNINEILTSPFIMLDIDHTGKTEKIILDFLIDNKWHGLLLLDDIYLNSEMQQFWSDITLPKYDLSHMGHFSGTGLVEL